MTLALLFALGYLTLFLDVC